MNKFLAQRVTIPDNVLMRELDGESVILDLDSEKYYGLDDIGTRMWQLLTSTDSVQETYNSLLLEFDVEPQRLEQDMQDLVSQLVANDLLVLQVDTEAA